MNTLFTKILLWFGIMLASMFVGIVVITAIQFQDAPPRGPFQPFYGELALEALEEGGKEELRNFLDRYGRATHSEVFLLDSDNRDLVTGEVRAVPRRGDDGPPLFPLFGRRGPGIRVMKAGDYQLVSVSQNRDEFAWWVVPQNLWILAVGILLSFALAAYLSSPLRKLQRAVESYGEGDLDARLHSRRRDEFGKLARAFDTMADRIQTLLAAERRLLLDISHELRSPLARMSVATELLDDPEEREAARAQIRRETERLNQLIGGLLEVTRAEGDPAHLPKNDVALAPLVSDIVQDCSYEARERNVEIDCESPENIHLAGDPELLRRAIENILRNALRYSPPHSSVAMTSGVEDNVLTLRIRDFGPGVPDEALDRIFDPFFRVEDDRNRRQGGSGLGLSIARRAIELHRGTVQARNANPGLCVEIRLSVKPIREEALA